MGAPTYNSGVVRTVILEAPMSRTRIAPLPVLMVLVVGLAAPALAQQAVPAPASPQGETARAAR